VRCLQRSLPGRLRCTLCCAWLSPFIWCSVWSPAWLSASSCGYCAHYLVTRLPPSAYPVPHSRERAAAGVPFKAASVGRVCCSPPLPLWGGALCMWRGAGVNRAVPPLLGWACEPLGGFCGVPRAGRHKTPQPICLGWPGAGFPWPGIPVRGPRCSHGRRMHGAQPYCKGAGGPFPGGL
jgi:hypothetical protein